MASVTFRPLSSLADFTAVVELEKVIWGPGYADPVPAPILAVTTLRGGILIGAFDGDRMVGFVYSLPAIKDGRPTQWSHMLGVIPEYRQGGLGRELKMLQRERTIAMGLDLIEWTFDPLQAANAHLNFAKLGAVAEEYEVNVYGESTSPLHGGNPTDRLIAEWWVRSERVEQRLGGSLPMAPVVIVERANRTRARGEWLEPVDVRTDLADRHISVEIPVGFSDMLARAPELALTWRLAVREIFLAYFGAGYRTVEFFLNRGAATGSYLLTRT